MIMDTLAAFALATEPPLPSVLKEETFKETSNVLTPTIWRQVIGVAVWNVIVLLFLIIAGPALMGDKLYFKF